MKTRVDLWELCGGGLGGGAVCPGLGCPLQELALSALDTKEDCEQRRIDKQGKTEMSSKNCPLEVTH